MSWCTKVNENWHSEGVPEHYNHSICCQNEFYIDNSLVFGVFNGTAIFQRISYVIWKILKTVDEINN